MVIAVTMVPVMMLGMTIGSMIWVGCQQAHRKELATQSEGQRQGQATCTKQP